MNSRQIAKLLLPPIVVSAVRGPGPSPTLQPDIFGSTMPVEPLNTDLYLVAFPKSGVTWLSFMLANVNLIASGNLQQRATFYNINDLIPDIHLSRNIAAPAAKFPGFRMIKSHSPYNPRYTKVLYLIREPLHVMASYYAFLTGLGMFSGDMREMVEHREFGVQAWVSHVEGWIKNVQPQISFSVLKYEELKARPHQKLRELYQMWGFELDENVFSTAAARASLAAMRSDEALYNATNPSLKNFKFVREGGADGTRLPVDESLSHRIAEAAQSVTGFLQDY